VIIVLHAGQHDFVFFVLDFDGGGVGVALVVEVFWLPCGSERWVIRLLLRVGFCGLV
jgi:hypothetical protein